ncbi:MAG: diguanylate cyclase (GGDEF)-like protein [Phycisphaerales bacterium]|jgi:diguanylate cyclase (GGDEF)-like protein
MNTPKNMIQKCRRQVLIIEENTATAGNLMAALAAPQLQTTFPQEQIDCTTLSSAGQFFESDPSSWDVVVTALNFKEGSGFDVLSFVQGLRPDVPVIMIGHPDESEIAVEAIKAGASDYLMITGHEMITFPVTVQKCLALQLIRTENDDLHADLSRSLTELAVANRELQQLIQRLEIAARTDDLTKLSNRRWLNLMLENRWEEATRNGIPLAFMMIDLDGFKACNDNLGHQKGDEILRLAARVLEANCRSIDISARFGGDEFCVLMPHANPDAALQIAHRIASAFDEAVAAISEQKIGVSMSIGVAHWQITNPISADELVRHADEAMYKAKSDCDKRVVLAETPSRWVA